MGSAKSEGPNQMKRVLAFTISAAILTGAATSPAAADWRGRGGGGWRGGYGGGWHEHHHRGGIGPGIALGLGLGALGGALLYNPPPVYYAPPGYYPPPPVYYQRGW